MIKSFGLMYLIFNFCIIMVLYIHKYLKTHPHVKDYRVGVYGEGEMGVTIVNLKW